MSASRSQSHGSSRGSRSELIPASPSERVQRVFTWYTRRLFMKRFFAVRFEEDSISVISELDQSERPIIVLMNHAGWWDPLVGVLLGDEFLPSRSARAPMDRAQLERFQFMRKLGIFGIDPDEPSTEAVMRDYVLSYFADSDRPTLWITPQGQFTDVRSPIRLRPGAASIAAHCDSCSVLCISVEYAFWQDQKPEVFIRCASCEAERSTTASWLRAMTRTMQHNGERLAELVIGRDPAPMRCIVGGSTARTNPVYDLWLRIRGKSGSIAERRDRSGRNKSQSKPSQNYNPRHAS